MSKIKHFTSLYLATCRPEHRKVNIKTIRNVSTLEMCECYSCTLDTGGVTG